MYQYTDEELNAVWNKGKIIEGQNPNLVRVDSMGFIIHRAHYGLQIPTGWEVDHIIPLSKGGAHKLSNWQPLNWIANNQKSDNVPNR